MNNSTTLEWICHISNDYNQTQVCEWLTVFRHWSMAAMSFSAIVLNTVIIVVLFRNMKQQRQTQAHIHLQFLAYSDFSVAVVFIAAAIWGWINPNCAGM